MIRGALANMTSTEKHVVDIAAPVIAAASLAEWLPSMAAALSILWLVIRLYEYIRWVRRGRKPEEKP